ncbi:MAG: hypothetical protein KDC82_04960 [Bacteroidetes bacterium]|nr:hypothetical protein [Bacteroidota bacterium]
MLDSLDKDIPDEIRFSYLKKIFFVTASEKCYSRESNLPQQFMKICRTLSSGEIIVLNACYRICQKNWQKEHNFQSASEWVKIIANISDLKYTALVEIHEQKLIEKRLISRRIHGDRSGVVLQPYFRLTDLGYEICSYIEKYEEIEK